MSKYFKQFFILFYDYNKIISFTHQNNFSIYAKVNFYLNFDQTLI